MHHPILTIAIPTYNRPDFIKSQIKALLPQITDDVVIVVLDNHSVIPVETILSEAECDKVSIIRNDNNIGADANIAKCFDLCKTKWLWTLSDDDVISSDAVNTVLHLIITHSSSAFINFNNNRYSVSKGLTEFISNYEDYQRLFWMSVCVYNIEALGDCLQYYHYSISSMQPGVILLVKALSKDNSKSVVFSDGTIVLDGGEMVSWNRESFMYATLFVFDILRDEKRVLNSTLFHSIAAMLYHGVRTNFKINHSISQAIWRISLIIRRRGIWPSFLFDIKSIGKTFACVFFNTKV